jgi:NTE family protein
MTTSLFQQLEGKRVGVVLSAGFFGFYGHAGFVDGLQRSGITVGAWAGTSAGGMVAAFSAAGLPPTRIAELVLAQRREHFWDPDYLGIAIDAVRKGHRPSGLLQGTRFRTLLEEFLPIARFEDLTAPLLIVATNLSSQRPLIITSGDLASAIHATCAYPGLFQAVRREGALLWDGGIVDKAPVLALADSKAFHALDALLVHYLPSRESAKEPKGAFAWPSGMASGFAAIRRDHFRLQLEVLKSRGVPTYVVESNLPPVSPRTMETGIDAVNAGRDAAIDALKHPPRAWSGAD